jgi:hypothetical protein
MTRIQFATLIASGLTLAACASSGASYEPVADGPTSLTYAADLEASPACCDLGNPTMPPLAASGP